MLEDGKLSRADPVFFEVNVLAIDFGVMLTEYLQEAEKNKSKTRSIGKYYASELGNECLRQSYYRYTLNHEIEPFTLGVFALGNILHDFLGNVYKIQLEKDGHVVELEKEVPPYKNKQFEIHGRADMLVDESLVVDIKTVSPNAFKFGSLPYESHKSQVMFYMHQLAADEAGIIYVDKYALRIVPYVVEYEPKLFRSSVSQIRNLHKSLLSGELPPRHEAFPKKYPCSYCPYQLECEKNGPQKEGLDG